MTISEALRRRVQQAAGFRCGYCLVPARYVYATMEIDHIMPRARGGSDDEHNLWLACPRCNTYKRDLTEGIDRVTGEMASLFNPRTQQWTAHFRFNGDDPAIIEGQDATGRVTVAALRINGPLAVDFRRVLIEIGAYPPDLG